MIRARLGNGLRVLVDERPECARVAVGVHYGVGFRTEPPGWEGFAHLFEHLMFRGSRHLPIGAFFPEVYAVGGQAGGHTHQDYTEFFQIVPAPVLREALFREADRMRAPAFTPDSIAEQLAGVAVEIRAMTVDRPYGGFPWPLLPAVLFRTHANAHDGYGDVARLARVTPEDCYAFFHRWYTPSNAVLTISGGVTAAGALALADELFGDIPDRPVTVPDTREPPPGERRWLSCGEPGVRRTAVALGAVLPDPLRELPRYLAYQVLASMLPRRLDRPGVDTACGFFDPLDALAPDTLVITALLAGRDRPASFPADVDQALRRLSTDEELAADLDRSVAGLVAAHHRRHAEPAARCRALGRWEVLFGRPELLDQLPALWRSTEPQALRAAAADLAETPWAIVEMTPADRRTRPAPPTLPTERTPQPDSVPSAGRFSHFGPADPAGQLGFAEWLPPGAPTRVASGPVGPPDARRSRPVPDTGRHPTSARWPALARRLSRQPTERRPLSERSNAGDRHPGRPNAGDRHPGRPNAGDPVSGRSPARGPKPGRRPLRAELLDQPNGDGRLVALPDPRATLTQLRVRWPLGAAGIAAPGGAHLLAARLPSVSGAKSKVEAFGGTLELATDGQWLDLIGDAPAGRLRHWLAAFADLLAAPAPPPDHFPPSDHPPPPDHPPLSDHPPPDRPPPRDHPPVAELSAFALADVAWRRCRLSPEPAGVIEGLAQLVAPGAVAVLVSAADPAEVAAAVEDVLGARGFDLGAGRAPMPGPDVAPPVLAVPRAAPAEDHLTLYRVHPEIRYADPARYLATGVLGGSYQARLSAGGGRDYQAYCGRDGFLGAGRCYVRAVVRPGMLGPAAKDIAGRIAGLVTDPPGSAEIASVRRYCAAQALSLTDAPAALADALGQALAWGAAVDSVTGLSERLAEVTDAEVVRACAELFGTEPPRAVTVGPGQADEVARALS
ncbi:hypothetical protein GCM10023321_77400 [Pseudonocardia eucalypti]|uniref:Zn-dependent peptidase n=1 Tax=Pseudonocardia eucalypti TaxID=648755 RepID=A0ABP9RBR9_9PSEU|nr:putative Zn-dependent peptidase [Pseudonocardia eucalypti]